MTAKQPSSVAIIIPIYRHYAYLRETLQSTAIQTMRANEILVVDDGSPEESARHIRSICNEFPNIQLHNLPHGGAAKARYDAALLCSSDYVIFLDADDTLLPNAVQLLSHALDEHPTVSASYAQHIKTDKDGTPLDLPTPHNDRFVSGLELLHLLLSGLCHFNSGAICIRRSAFLNAPQNNHGINQSEDWMLYCHLARMGGIIAAEQIPVLHYRQHENGISNRFADELPASLKAYELIYTDPAFAQAVGAEKLQALAKRHYDKLNRYFTSYYLARGETQKAQACFHSIKPPPQISR